MVGAPVICLSHGGGPMPVLGDPSHKDIINSFKNKVPKLLRLGTADAPRAIVLITAHWSQDIPTISNGPKPSLYFDYGGFPPESYRLKYDAPGAPDVASEVSNLLKSAGIESRLDSRRGWDHGVFIPMLLINPKADIPVVQVSVLQSEDPADHYKMGQAMESLRDSNVAIIGSGFATVHNLGAMFSGAFKDPSFLELNKQFSETLSDAVLEEKSEERAAKLSNWRQFPGTYQMHPRGGGEHFMPLLVCAGAAGDSKGDSYADDFLGVKVLSYLWN